ncbi:MAG: Phytanoyl-CoA dioxygenase [Phycisphaerales bacterium]|nr:Phytanoyl-CoA dioxygenase [Phycisphaerales bacterium]
MTSGHASGLAGQTYEGRLVSDRLEEDGYAIRPGVVPPDVIDRLIGELSSLAASEAVRGRADRVFAVRNLLALSPGVRELVRLAAVRRAVEAVIGEGAKVVRAILFDKVPGANWKVAWHQDLSIAVRQRRDVPGFGPWSVKAGVPHVQPPAELLGRMLTLRLHLDDCGEANGPLRVLPGSHRHGSLARAEVERWRGEGSAVACHVPAGGAVLMRPLLLHASSAATAAGHRRVVHLEWSADPLPDGLHWHEQA